MKKSLSQSTTRIVIAIWLAVLMLAAAETSLSLLQQNGYATSQAKKQEQSTIQNLRENLAKRTASRQQHLDQENLCLRADKCSNSNVGEQTLGNDNSVTGFSDQSKNVQQTPQNQVVPTSSPTPTPTASPTPTPTASPTPTPTASPTPTALAAASPSLTAASAASPSLTAASAASPTATASSQTIGPCPAGICMPDP